jgi:hypothetical protein
MWYGLCTQAAKDEAEKFSNDQKVIRNAETIGNIVIRQSVKRAEQAAKDEALWKQMKREFPRC